VSNSSARRAKDARIQRILATLSPGEREALERFYNLQQDIPQISRAVGMSERELHELKLQVKKAFLAAGWSQ
jgi:hypothetical protein